jgi:hypothetical protein
MFRTRFSSSAIAKLSRSSFLNLNKTMPKHVFYHELFISMGEKSLNIVTIIPDNIFDIVN